MTREEIRQTVRDWDLRRKKLGDGILTTTTNY